MRTYNLLARNLRWYWRTNLAVVLGVATAAGVLGGAVLVGESVRASLRDIALGRLGNVDSVISRNGFVREGLFAPFSGAPVIALEATVTSEAGDRVSGVELYGVDERFWKFQGLQGEAPGGRDAILTPALAHELGAQPDNAVLVRVRKPSAIPLESLHGRKDDVGKTLRLRAAAWRGREFSLRPRQGELKAVYVPLALLQRELGVAGKVNSILVGGNGRNASELAGQLRSSWTLADVGMSLRTLETPGAISVESDSALISDALAKTASDAAQALGLRAQPVLTYLANTIKVECAPGVQVCPTVPYSVVAALDSEPAPASDDGIVLNDWTAHSLNARPGDTIALDYFVWKPDGRLATESAVFHVERVVGIQGAAADRNYVPTYPGITDSQSLRDWDPPFPLDLARVRPGDERYWSQYGATPKAFIRLERGRQLWGTRFGSLSSVRISPLSAEFGPKLRSALDPLVMGLSLASVRATALEAARGATDFDEYFLYFSFFLIVSALLLTGLFFRLGIEQRSREIGILLSLGFPLAMVRNLFLMEGAALALTGAMVGTGVALGYCGFVLLGLRTWWVAAVGTQSISLHASAAAVMIAAGGGVVVGLATVVFSLRSLRSVTPRGLVAGQRTVRRAGWRWIVGAVTALAGIALACAAFFRVLDEATGFFGAGALLLIATMLLVSGWLHAGRFGALSGKASLGLRSLAYHPGRSVLCITLIASATFVIVSLDAFRRDGNSEGIGGYPLIATSDVPLIYDPNSTAGRNSLNLSGSVTQTEFVPFRVKPGDDASCRNLYRPLNPRIMAPPPAFLRQARFAFQSSVSKTANPWLLLEDQLADGAIPAIADANSMTYTMHLKPGDEFRVDGVRYKMVAALRDSLFQGELLISEANFLRLFPGIDGYRFFLIKAPQSHADQIPRELEESLSDYGFDVQQSAARLAGFHQVENTYLSTFRALGGLGLILGTVGLAAVLLRNVLERRRELALLRAVGYRPRDLAAIVLVENTGLLVLGVATGTACALPAILPAVSARGGHVPLASLGALLGVVLATGIAASLAATAVALRFRLQTELKSE